MSNLTKLTTILDYIRFALSQFSQAGLYYGHGTDNAYDEAHTLVLAALHLPQEINCQFYHAQLTKAEREQIEKLIALRVEKRIPMPYLIHTAWFCDLSFYVDERVLIPRSSLAEVIKNEGQPWVECDAVTDILDLCTGSACIAIACAKYFPQARIDASDVSQDALEVARVNLLRHRVEEQVQLFHSDLFQSLPVKQYDIIFSNPPYVSLTEMAQLPEEYRHEPALGLTAGEKGLDIIEKILQHALAYLKPRGVLIVEVGNSEEALIAAYPDLPFTWLEFEESEGGVFLLDAKTLHEYFKGQSERLNCVAKL
jgi:ribosomal protein L3 glutamine methyltransferase